MTIEDIGGVHFNSIVFHSQMQNESRLKSCSLELVTFVSFETSGFSSLTPRGSPFELAGINLN